MAKSKKPLSEKQRAALARGRAKRAANVQAGGSSKPRAPKASKASKPRASKASKPRASKASKPRASKGGAKLTARVAELERRVDNHAGVLSDLVGVVEAQGQRLDAIEAAFGQSSSSGRGARTVMMPAVRN